MEVRRRTTALKMASTSMHASTRQLLGSVFTNFTQGIDADGEHTPPPHTPMPLYARLLLSSSLSSPYRGP